MKDIIGNFKGIKTGFSEFDKMSGGFSKGDLIIMASRPSIGKTALALNMISNIGIKYKKHVGFFSLENDEKQIINKLIAIGSNIDLDVLVQKEKTMNKQQWQNINVTMKNLKESKILINDNPIISIIDIKKEAIKQQRDRGLDIIFIDYLQLIKVPDTKKKSDSGKIFEIVFSSLKDLAKELNIPIIVLAQLNRTFSPKKSKISDLKNSGIYEKYADFIIFLNKEKENNEEVEICAKNLIGSIGSIKLTYLPEFNKFVDIRYVE